MKKEIIIRTARTDDAEELLAIYAPYVEKTAITFEYEVPSVEEFRSRMIHTLQKYPYLVAEEISVPSRRSSRIVGYAYAGVFKGRAAYDRAVETTIYLREGEKGHGVGRRLYEELERVSKAQGILNLYACIGYPETEDEFLTKNSAQFHEHLGYRLVGQFHHCGFKFGRWYDMVWMEKMIGEHTACPQPVIPFAQMQ